MSPNIESILQQAMSLPRADRLELLDAIDAATAAESTPMLDQSWLDEIQRRSAEVDAGTAKTYTWEEVQAELRRRDQQ